MAEEEDAKWSRKFAMEANNAAWRLSERTQRSPEQDQAMLHAAHAAAHHWAAIGTEVNRMRADMLLGHVHALLGDGFRALAYAQKAFRYVTSHASEPWEVAFAHVVLANAAAAAGDRGLHEENHRKAREIGAALPADERPIFEATFRVVPAPE